MTSPHRALHNGAFAAHVSYTACAWRARFQCGDWRFYWASHEHTPAVEIPSMDRPSAHEQSYVELGHQRRKFISQRRLPLTIHVGR